MKRKATSFFIGLSSALIRGVDKATADMGLSQPSPIVQNKVTQTPREWRGMSFMQHILDTYGGERHGRMHTKETMDLNALQKDALANPGDVRDETGTLQTQARCPKCDALLMLGAVGARDNCPKCDTLLVVKLNSEWNIKTRQMREWRSFDYAKPGLDNNMKCAGCEKPFTALDPLVVGDTLQPNDITFCGECGRVNTWTGSGMALLSDEDVAGLPVDVYKAILFAREQVRLKVAAAHRKIQNNPIV